MRAVKENEPCTKIPPQLDIISAVKEFHILSYKDLSKLIKDAENGNIKWTKSNGSSFEINLENLARNLPKHIMAHLLSFKRDEQHFSYLLSGLRLLHTFCIASRHSKLEQVLFDDVKVGEEIFDLIFFMIAFLNCSEEKINSSSHMALLYSALLASSLYLFTAYISTKWHELTPVLLSHYKVEGFMSGAFTAVRAVIKFLQVNLPAQHVDSRMKSNVEEVYLLLQLCEASLQFLQSLCQQKLFRERLLNNKELCEDGVIFQLVRNILKLSQSEDPNLMDVIYRLKSKVLSIMLLLCEEECSSFLDMVSSTTLGLDLAKSTVFEVLEVLRMMFCGGLKNHPRGILQLNAMRLTEIFSDDSSFRTYIVLNLTEVLTRVFSQPQREFLSTWCSSERGPIEEDFVMDFDPLSASGQVLGVISTSRAPHSTWSNFRAPQAPYAHQISSLLVKILANLTCFVPDLCKEEKGLFINEFLECLQKEFSKLPGGAAERTAAASRNLRSLLAHAGSLTPEYLNEDDVHLLRLFVSQLEQLIASQESDIYRIKEVYNRGQCSSPTPQISSPDEHDRSDYHTEGVSLNLAMVQLNQLTFEENDQNQSDDVAREDQITNLDENSGAQSIETINRIKNVEMVRSMQSEEKQQKKRKRNKMNDIQISMIESALLDQPDMQRRAGSLQIWADKLSLHGSEVTSSQLKNWLNNRKAKLARAAAKDARATSGGDDVLTEKQSGSGPDPISDSPESLIEEYFDPPPSASQGAHQRGLVLRICGTETTQDTVLGPTSSFKRENGQYVMLTNDQGEEVGKGIIHLATGIWFGNNLEEIRLSVVDINELKVDKWAQLPYPSDAGTTFGQAEMILGRMRVLWDSSKLLLIQKQMP